MFDSYPIGRKLVERDKPERLWSQNVFSEKYQKHCSFLSVSQTKLSIFSDILKENRLKNSKGDGDDSGEDGKKNKKSKKGKKSKKKPLKR